MLGMNEIGGGIVRRRFNTANGAIPAGHKLTSGEIKAMPPGNRRALIENRFLEVWPIGNAPAGGERHIVNLGFGKFDVVEGRKLNDKPLTKDEAEELATRP